MKRNRFSSSEGSSSEADSPLTEKLVKPHLKKPRLLSELTNMAEADTDDMQLKTFKEETSSNFGELTVTMSEMRLQLQDQIKRVHDDVTAMQTSLSNARLGIESLKADAEGNKQKVEELDKQVRTLKAEMEAEKQKRLQLNMYSRRENLRLIGIQEKEQEDVEKIVRGLMDGCFTGQSRVSRGTPCWCKKTG